MHLAKEDEVCYPIIIDAQLLKRPDKWLPSHYRNKKIIIITDEDTKNHYGQTLVGSLENLNPLLLSFPSGEQSKNYQTKQYIEEKMLQHLCDRESIILALGGGVVGDMAGFVASTYMRGISYIQLPTTLLAMVDSSVGGKTGINNAYGKNLIGSFWQPAAVVADVECLNTLPKKHLISGLIEIIKIFMTSDKDAINNIYTIINGVLARDITALKETIHRAIKIKVSIVSQDECESHLRKILNFGHTIGHAIEKVSNYSMLHGYAVAYGILVEAKISQLLGILSADEFIKIQKILQHLNIVGSELKKYHSGDIIQATKSDKKNTSDQVRYVLLEELGKVYLYEDQLVHFVSDEVVSNALNIVNEMSYVR